MNNKRNNSNPFIGIHNLTPQWVSEVMNTLKQKKNSFKRTETNAAMEIKVGKSTENVPNHLLV